MAPEASAGAALLAVSGAAGDGRPGGLVLVAADGSHEWLDEVDSGVIACDDTRVARVLRGADSDRIAVYDADGLRAVDRVPGNARVAALWLEADALLAELLPDGSRARLAPDGSWTPAGEDGAALDGAAQSVPEGLDVPLGAPAGAASVAPALVAGLRIGGRVSPFRAQETEQARAFADAGVTPSVLWASGAPLAVPDCHVEIEAGNPTAMAPADRVQIPYRLRNLGSAILASGGASPVWIATRWRDPETGAEVADVMTIRSPLTQPVPPGCERVGEMTLVAPNRPGTFHIQVTLLQERVRWFSDVDDRSAHWAVVVVSGGEEAGAG